MPRLVPLENHREYSEAEMRERAADFRAEMQRRRAARLDRRMFPRGDKRAGRRESASLDVRGRQRRRGQAKIRSAAETEEKEFYDHRATPEWLATLEPLGTDWRKPFLETAPYLIAIFEQRYGVLPGGKILKHYYAMESVGIATGFLIAALHHAGLATFTHTPSPMNFLNVILGRPENEKPFLLLIVGHPAQDAQVPAISRNSLDEISRFR